MAQLQGSGQISLGNANTLKRASNTANNSLRDREREYMSANNTWNASTGVCMPDDLLTVTNAENNTGTLLARNQDGTWSYTAAAGYTASTPWGPHSLKEFYSAYNGIPSVSLAKANTGNFNTFTMTVTIGGEFAKNGSNYFISIDNAAWQGWPGNASGVYSVVQSRGTHTVKVKDFLNCGADSTIVASITYP